MDTTLRNETSSRIFQSSYEQFGRLVTFKQIVKRSPCVVDYKYGFSFERIFLFLISSTASMPRILRAGEIRIICASNSTNHVSKSSMKLKRRSRTEIGPPVMQPTFVTTRWFASTNDMVRFRVHWTIQNKVEEQTDRESHVGRRSRPSSLWWCKRGRRQWWRRKRHFGMTSFPHAIEWRDGWKL